MRSYQFRYQHGQSAPYKTLEAGSDVAFWSTALPAWEKQTGFKHIAGTVVCTVMETYKVAELSAQAA